MEYTILKSFDHVSLYINQVSNIADNNKGAFGFLASSAYDQMASKGQLWVIVNEARELKGYLMFGGTMPSIKVFQIYSCRSVKGHRIGSRLISSLKDFAKAHGYHSIVARVASDLPANEFWSKLGFQVYKQVKGGETTKRIINVRGFVVNDNDLFGSLGNERVGVRPTGPVLKKRIYALDLNLLLDVSKARPGYEQIVKIMQVGFQGGFSICITPEFKAELERQSSHFSDDPVLRMAGAFPELMANTDVQEIAESLRRDIFPSRTASRKSAQNDESDLRHLAYCISAKIDGFITREKALLRSCNDIKYKYGCSILSPDELITDNGFSKSDKPLNSDFSFSSSTMTDELSAFLRSFSVPELVSESLDSASPTKEGANVYEARLDGELFGIYYFQKPVKSSGHALAALYIDESRPQAIAAIDHFLEMALRYKCSFSHRLDLYIGKDQDITAETLAKKGFFKSADHFVKIMSSEFLDRKNWPVFARTVKTFCEFSIPEKLPSKKELQNTGIFISDAFSESQVFSWFDFETAIGPKFILSSDRDCIIVPIREKFANGLIGNVKNQLSLLSSHQQIFLLEKAYFRSPVRESIFTRGGVIAFYVSGIKSIQEIIGFARITFSDVIDIDEAAVKFDRQGVLSKKELLDISDGAGRVHVFTFDNFIEFDRRVSFSRAKELGLISNANLVSPERIGVDKLKVLIGEAYND